MRKYVNGEYMDMTPEEIAAIEAAGQEQPAQSPTQEDRLDAVEQAVQELILMTMGGE